MSRLAEEDPETAGFAEKAADGAPEDMPWLDWVWRAWHRLSDERAMTFSGMAAPMGAMVLRSIPGRIPWTAVNAWCQAHGYRASEREFLEICLEAMDGEFITWWKQEMKK